MTTVLADSSSDIRRTGVPPRAPRDGTQRTVPLPKPPTGLNSPTSSRDAKRTAAAVLEVLAGTRSPNDAAKSLGVSLPRYYQIEARAFRGLVSACEPQPTGRRSSSERELRKLQKELQRLEREHTRQQALVRAAQRTIGLSFPEKPATQGKAKTGSMTKRARRPCARALKAVRALRADATAAESSGDSAALQPAPKVPVAPAPIHSGIPDAQGDVMN